MEIIPRFTVTNLKEPVDVPRLRYFIRILLVVVYIVLNIRYVISLTIAFKPAV